jgi:alkylhydroperoxidase family enzyme
MRVTEARITPISDEELNDDAREFITQASRDGRVLNIYRTLARHPKLLKRWGVFGTHILYKNSIPARERELVILRTGWLCRSEYEWGQHVLIGRAAGLTDDEIERIKEGSGAERWSAKDEALLRATDELHSDSFIGDATWAALLAHYDTQQLMDLVFTVGQYHIVSMALNSFGVQLDEGVPGFDG